MIDQHNISANNLFVGSFQQFDVKTMVIERNEHIPKACVCFLPYLIKTYGGFISEAG